MGRVPGRRWGYLLTGYRKTNGKIVRFLLSDFTTIETLNMKEKDEGVGSADWDGGFTDGNYGYMVDRMAWNHGKGRVVRFSLSDFTPNGVELIELTSVNTYLRGFSGGFSDGTYGYAVPYYNGQDFHKRDGQNMQAANEGILARWPLSDFSTGAIETLNVRDACPVNYPKGCYGFKGGFTDYTYGYLVPHDAAGVSGKLVRFSLSDFTPNSVSVLDLRSTNEHATCGSTQTQHAPRAPRTNSVSAKALTPTPPTWRKTEISCWVSGAGSRTERTPGCSQKSPAKWHR